MRSPSSGFFGRLPSSWFLAFVAFTIFLLFMPTPVRAFTNNTSCIGTGTTTTAGGSFTITSRSSCNIGDLMILTVSCVGQTVSTITDVSTDSWSVVGTSNPRLDVSGTIQTEGWYALAKSTATGIITVTLTGSAACTYVFMGWNTDATFLNSPGTQNPITGTVVRCGTSGGTPQQCAASGTFANGGTIAKTGFLNLFSPYTTGSPDNLVASFFITNGTAAGSDGGVTGTMETVQVASPFTAGTTGKAIGGGGGKIGMVSAWQYSVAQLTSNVQWQANFNGWNQWSNPSAANTNGFISITLFQLVFQSNGVAAPTCNSGSGTFGTIVGSGAITTTSPQALVSNQTYLYVANTGMVAGSLTSIKIQLSSVSLTNSQTSAKLTMAVYMAFGQPSAAAISAATPLFEVLTPGPKTFTIVNNANPQTITFNTLLTIPANSTFAIAIGISHNGANIYQAADTPQMYLDTADAFVSNAPPTSLTSLVTTSPPLFISGAFSQPCFITSTSTFVQSAVATTTLTAIVTSTSVATSIDTNVAMSTTPGFILDIIMILGPAVILGAVGAFTKSAALTGGLFIGGLAIGAGIGNLSGVVPFSILAVIIVVIVFLIIALIMSMRSGGAG